MRGTEEQIRREPQNYIRLDVNRQPVIFAYGRDPYFAGWPDTLHVNYQRPALQVAMGMELLNIAGHCDGVRCDMAMLILPDVFERTWKLRPDPFWPRAIKLIRD